MAGCFLGGASPAPWGNRRKQKLATRRAGLLARGIRPARGDGQQEGGRKQGDDDDSTDREGVTGVESQVMHEVLWRWVLGLVSRGEPEIGCLRML